MAKQTLASPDRDIRAAVEQAYGGPLPDESWQYLVDGRHVAELRQGLSTADELVNELRKINRAAPAAIRRADRRVLEHGDGAVFKSINRRCAAIAELVALRARRGSKVRAFRRRALPDGLVDSNGIDAWIRDVYYRSIPEDWPRHPGPEAATNNRLAFIDMPRPSRELQWIDYEEQALRIWCVPRRGVLGDLAELSKKLADTWDWNVAHATEFLLSDATPPRPGIRGITRKNKRGWDDQYGAYSLPAIRLTIDVQVTPEELAAWWRTERRHLGVRGHRPISDASVELALFAATRDDTTTWKQDCKEWNLSSSAEKRFDDWRNYRTAAIRALTRLNHPAGATP